jgi:hypothetical protein
MSGAQSTSGFAADAPRYGAEPVAAYYQLNQTGAPTPVETLNGLSGQVTVSLNGAPISPSGQNINIVAGTGVLGLTAAGNTSSGTVPLTSGDGSVVFTNPGGTNGAIDFSAIIPPTRLNGTLTNNTGTFQYLILGGAGVSTSGRPIVATLSGLTSGKSYLLNIVVNFGIYPGWTTSGVVAPQLQFGWDNTGTNLPPFVAPASLGRTLTFPLSQDFGTLATAAPSGGTSYNILTQTVSCIVVAQSTSIELNVNTSGQTTGPIITVDASSFMQVVELD